MHSYAVIIPTTCAPERAPLLERALASVDRAQAELVIVANGPRVDDALLHRLRDSGAAVHRLEIGNVSIARREGVARSTAPLFCFLDDDDEFLPGGLAQRAARFEPSLACVVTNGYLREGDVDSPLVPPRCEAAINHDPVGAFLQHNWFASPASMFQRSVFPLALLDTTLRFFEWTQIFFRMVERGLQIHYVDAFTYRKYEDHPYSVSKSAEYATAYSAFVRDELLPLKLPPDVRRKLRQRYATALNSQSVQQLAGGHRAAAWAAHVRCLAAGGWSYLPYTRRLLL